MNPLNYFIFLFITSTLCDEINTSSDDRLFLSPLLERNEIETARNLSKVIIDSIPINITSYSGYITVDKNFNSNLWFWYFAVDGKKVEDVPLILWLQGGPGMSSLYGLFEEIGPFSVNENETKLIENPNSWLKNYNLLFVDNPVGTGFSFTDDENGYATNQTTIAKHLYEFITQFIQIYPELQRVPFYMAGRSYAGKHIPSLAYEIHQKNPSAELKINLKGLIIGNPFIDPASTQCNTELLLHIGLIDEKQSNAMAHFENLMMDALVKENYTDAHKNALQMLIMFEDYTKLPDVYNYLSDKATDLSGPFILLIESEEFRKALHIGQTKFTTFDEVYTNLLNDLLSNSKTQMETLLNHYKILLFSGQLDTIVPYYLSARLYKNFKWDKAEEFGAADRKPWFMDNKLVGYTKNAGNFMEVMIRNAGHSPIADQPERMFALVNSFINETPLNQN